MQKNVLKQQFENFYVSDTKGLDKAYDRFQKLINLLEVHGAAVSNKDANQKFLRALPLSWNNVALIMRNKDGIDDLDIDDLYNNLKVFEADIKGSSGSSSNSQNVVFLSTKDTSSSNEVNIANGSNSPKLDDEDLEQIDHDDLEEMDLKWQVVMLSMRDKQFYKKTGGKLIFNGKEPVGYRSRDNTRRTVPVETFDALVVQDNALIGLTQSKANLEIVAYQLGLESVEAQLVVHQKNEVVYEEKIAVLEFEVNSQLSSKDKTGLEYGDQLNESDSSGSELFNSVYDSRSSDGDDNQTNDRPTANKTSASVSQVEASTSQSSNTSVEMPRVESVRPSGVIIEDWVSDDEDIFQSNDLQATNKPSLKRIGFTNARDESIKPKQAEKPRIITQNSKVDRRDWNGKMT
ncbi:hypothetical protein Tco_0769354 [Tanacetum coccineum]|uniref:Uncharacterized protein n=1 Tax=Tanacetum coccineum TaxID=301880 RepID=A0ABQ4ZCQ6_9ASTR